MSSTNNTSEVHDFPLPPTLVYDTPEHAINTAAPAFVDDVFQNYFTRTFLDVPSTEKLTVEHNLKAMNTTMPTWFKTGPFLVTSKETPTVTSIWELSRPSDPAGAGHEDMNFELPMAVKELGEASEPVWRAEFPTERVLHVAMIGNAATAARPASTTSSAASENQTYKPKGASHILTEMTADAKSLNIPVILESSSPKSRDIYAKRGFTFVKEIRVGVGKANAKGIPTEGGEGFPMYLMKYV